MVAKLLQGLISLLQSLLNVLLAPLNGLFMAIPGLNLLPSALNTFASWVNTFVSWTVATLHVETTWNLVISGYIAILAIGLTVRAVKTVVRLVRGM